MPLTNYNYGVASFGYPVVPWGMPFNTKTRYIFVDGTYGLDAQNGLSADKPVKTIARASAIMTDNYGDVAVIMPGAYAERIVPTKSHCAYIGATPWNPGLVQITGDGTVAPTIAVGTAAMEGFYLANLEVDVPSGVQTSCIRLTTDDATAGAVAGASGLRAYVGNVQIRSNLTRKDPRSGILLEGANMVRFGYLFIAGCQVGIGFTGSDSNNPSDIEFVEQCVFRDNAVADIACVNRNNPGVFAERPLTRVWFNRVNHCDEAGGVTNYANFGTIVASRCMISEVYSARDIADGTLYQLPVGWTVYEIDGRIIGA